MMIGVHFIVAGWMKLTTTPAGHNEAAAYKRNIHISVLRPKKMPRSIELLNFPPDVQQNPVATASAAVPQITITRFMTRNRQDSSDEEFQTGIDVHSDFDGTSSGSSRCTAQKEVPVTRPTKKPRRQTVEYLDDISLADECEITFGEQENDTC
jgi:hypothetical protein